MSINIKTLSERIKPNAWLTPGETGNILAASMQEAADLRAALAKYEAQMLRMATCAGEFAREACAAQAPSAPVARQPLENIEQLDERAAFEKEMNARRFFPAELDFTMTKSPSGKRDEYANTHLESCWNGWQARAALSVKAEECTWTPTADHWETGAWNSACGETWLFIDGSTPAENNVKFCQGCGKPVAAPTPPTTEKGE